MSDYVELSRDDEGIRCPACKKGYAESVEPTDEEEAKYGCGRPGCCSRAFVCAACGVRTAARAPAPDMDFS